MDDLMSKNGELSKDPVHFGTSWQVGGDPGCQNQCQGSCPDCSDHLKEMYGGRDFCGKLTDHSGPFKDCMGKVNPQSFFENCVYDVCLYKGLQSVLCQSISTYVTACQDAGANVYSWRSASFCDISCPANSTYELCAPSFPPSCVRIPLILDASCREDCQCISGFVQSGMMCVPESECGCFYNGNYYDPGEKFILYPLCTEECVCETNGQVTCHSFFCSSGQICAIEDRIPGCYPAGNKGKCSASGDPHYMTFDGRAFDFQGTCNYKMVHFCPRGLASETLAPFSVLVQNAKWGAGDVSVIRQVELQVSGRSFIMTEGETSRIKVDGVYWNLPISLPEVRVVQHGFLVNMQTNDGVELVYDLQYYLFISVPAKYYNQTCGLCGDFNGNPADDLKLADGSVTTDVQMLGASWKVTESGSNCTDGCGNDCPRCNVDGAVLFGSTSYCGLITAPSGSFSGCFSLIDPVGFFRDCVYDLCLSDWRMERLCHSLQAYTVACQEAGAEVQPWRNETFCPMFCPPNSQYRLCADTCSISCAAIFQEFPCSKTCAEGCECNAGYLADGNSCVTVENCGCFENGRYYKVRAKISLSSHI
ncbi:IgGFc-binding protein-like [Erpetoichthys calabaricus]|uniref:IgGFc-binding protein-like n=1 Tax=Erpetoichthys calabaricus TaxID=27687 RepID=UPI0022342225|nr:IgGFc-binding protein-like [Erpetoichthys calabaricus]